MSKQQDIEDAARIAARKCISTILEHCPTLKLTPDQFQIIEFQIKMVHYDARIDVLNEMRQNHS